MIKKEQIQLDSYYSVMNHSNLFKEYKLSRIVIAGYQMAIESNKCIFIDLLITTHSFQLFQSREIVIKFHSHMAPVSITEVKDE